jgi:hypothetical protein
VKPETIKSWLKANQKDRQWLANQCGVHKQTVDGWLSANRPISAPSANIIKGIISKGWGALNPRLTLEQYQRAQAAATQKGMSLEDWIADLIKTAIKLIIFAAIIGGLVVACSQ